MSGFSNTERFPWSVINHVTGVLPAHDTDCACSGITKPPRLFRCYQGVTGSCFRIVEPVPIGGRQETETADAKWLSREFLGHSWRVSGWKGKQETIRHGVVASSMFKERKNASSRT